MELCVAPSMEAKGDFNIMDDKCYSANEEDFYDFESALERAVESFQDENPDFSDEKEIELFEGEKVSKSIADFCPSFADAIADCACSDGEWSDSWAENIQRREKEIQTLIEDVLTDWADKNNMQPHFYGVKNVKPIKVKIKIDNKGEWETVES